MRVPTAVRDLALLLARAGIGAIFLIHGWQKVFTHGLSSAIATFRHLGVPLPGAAAVFACVVETMCAAALIAGVAVPVVGVLLFVDMLGAFTFVDVHHGPFVSNVGVQLVTVLGLASLLIAVSGGGRLSVDDLLRARVPRRSRAAGAHLVGRGQGGQPASTAAGIRTAPDDRP
jgi:putative oxidoreductase